MKHFDLALENAKEWSLDERNNIGEAVVCQSPLERKTGTFSFAASCSEEKWIVAKFINGNRIK